MSSWRAGCSGTGTSGSGERAGETATRKGDDAPRLDSHAWLAARTDKTAICRLLRVDWDTVGRIVERVCGDELDPARLQELYDIGVDEVSWKKQHNYLTLVADHRRGKIVWGTAGAGEKAADRFFAELDPGSPRAAAPPPTGQDADSSLSARARHAADEPEP